MKWSTLLSLRFIILSCLLFSFSLFSEDEEIRVELSTKNQLAPVYLTEFSGEKSSLKASYLKKLSSTLHFDLQHSGYIHLASSDPNLEKALTNQDPESAFSARFEKAGIHLILKAEVVDHKLDLYAFDVLANSLKKFEGVPLKGKLPHDTLQMHKLSDAIVKTYFQAEGIATTRLLYSVQKVGSSPAEMGWKAEIWECDYDGKNAKQITYEDNYAITPVFIPPHPEQGNERFLYVNYKNGQPKIYYSSLHSKTGNPLLSLRGNQLLPAISHQRDKIAFICDATGRADLFLQKVDEMGHLIGKPQQIFSYPRSTQASPTFHPDGSQIAFVSDKDGTPRIYLIPTSTPKNKRAIPLLLTKKNRENTCPSFSPDGTKIAYSAKTNGVRQIWIYNTLTGEEMQLTSGPGNKENPVWAPDSLHLVFNSTDPDHCELYLINLNQPEAVKLTDGPGKKHYPTWGIR